MDRAGANASASPAIAEKLNHNAVLMSSPSVPRTSSRAWWILPSHMKAHYYDGENGEKIRPKEIPAELLEQAKSMRTT